MVYRKDRGPVGKRGWRIMHIGFVCDEYPPAPHGGNGSLYSDLAEGLAAAGHRVTVVGVYPRRAVELYGQDERMEGRLRVVRLCESASWLRTRPRFLWDRFRLKRWFVKEHRHAPFDAIECPDYAGWLPFGGPQGVPVIVRIGGSNLLYDTELNRPGFPFEQKLERMCLQRADILAAVSGYAAERTLEICGMSGRRCTVVHNAVDAGLFGPLPEVSAEPGLIVFVNSLSPRKGIEQLMDAMNTVLATRTEARLVVIGEEPGKTGSKPEYKERLQQRLRPEFRSRVDFPGRLDRTRGVVSYLRRAAVCCYPSRMETFGLAPLEAMSTGRPTIFCRNGPGPELIEDGVSGLLCEPSDPQDIARKIIDVLADESLAARLGANARQRVLARFDKAGWIKRNIEFFEACRSQGRK